MKNLDFTSSLIGTRYSKNFSLPDFIRDDNGKIDRQKCLDILSKEEYGYISELGLNVRVNDVTFDDVNLYNGYLIGGKAIHKRILFSFFNGEFSSEFIVDYYRPTDSDYKKIKVVVLLNFLKEVPNKYCPIEELLDNGIGIAHVSYNEITKDNNDFHDGLTKIFCDDSKKDNPGKLALWAYASRWIAEYLIRFNLAVKGNIYVAGHSRLGKTALIACAYYDEFFAGCFVNCSGCAGAGIFREKKGEKIKDIYNAFPFWFTKNFEKYIDKENELPFDQHYLMGMVAPRKVFIVAGSEDEWADTDAQYLCAEASSVAYREMGLTGMESKDIAVGEKNDKGEIKFFKRKGAHYFTREDWHFYIDCLKMEK